MRKVSSAPSGELSAQSTICIEPGFSRRPVVHLILIVVIGLLVYSNTWHVPFQFDDEDFILRNPLLRDYRNLLEPDMAKHLTLPDNVRWSLRTRLVGYVSFCLNYKIHGFGVTGYHVLNFCIHSFNSVLVYFFVILTFRTPYFISDPAWARNRNYGYISLFSALLFASHPLQTEAVTYISQRFTSLGTFFYLLALVLYIRWRLRTDITSDARCGTHMLYAASFVSAILAMKTKENAFTLPVVIALYEFMFFRGTLTRRIACLFPFMCTMLIIPFSLIDTNKVMDLEIDKATRTWTTSRWDYLITESRVVLTYIRLLFLPMNQSIAYDYPLLDSLFDRRAQFALISILSVFCAAVYSVYASRRQHYALRMIAFGTFWFFITLSVESSIIPLADIIFEHRAYLPSAGAFPAIVAGIFFFTGRVQNKMAEKIVVASIVLVIAIFSYAAYVRNATWESDLRLWGDAAGKSPGNARAQYNLGRVYATNGLSYQAIEQFRRSIILEPDYAEAHNNLGAAYISKGWNDKAIEHLQIALKLQPKSALAENNLGLAYEAKGLADEAMEHYKKALALDPKLSMAHYNLGIIYSAKGMKEEAERHFRLARGIN